jgi:hypothetical protein
LGSSARIFSGETGGICDWLVLSDVPPVSFSEYEGDSSAGRLESSLFVIAGISVVSSAGKFSA